MEGVVTEAELASMGSSWKEYEEVGLKREGDSQFFMVAAMPRMAPFVNATTTPQASTVRRLIVVVDDPADPATVRRIKDALGLA